MSEDYKIENLFRCLIDDPMIKYCESCLFNTCDTYDLFDISPIYTRIKLILSYCNHCFDTGTSKTRDTLNSYFINLSEKEKFTLWYDMDDIGIMSDSLRLVL